MRLFRFCGIVSVVAGLLTGGPSAFGGQPARSRPGVKKRVSKPQVAHPKPHPHPLAGRLVKPHPFVRLEPARAYHRAYLPYGYHHSRSYHRRYGTHLRAYRGHGRYGRTNPAFQKAQAEMRRLQSVALILNNVPRGAAVNPSVVSTLQRAMNTLVVGGRKPSTGVVHALATDLVSTLEARTRPLADPMQLAYDLEAVLNAHVITPTEVKMAMTSADAVLSASGVPSGRLPRVNADMQQVALGGTAGQRRH